MSLSKLPQELLDRVAFFCGAEFLREDLKRVTLFKTWHASATRELQRHLVLNDGAALSVIEDRSPSFGRPKPLAS